MCLFKGSLYLKKDINVSHPLLIATSFLEMLHLLSILFILSLEFFHLSLHLIKYILQLSLILRLCLVYIKIPLIHHLFRFIAIVRLLNCPCDDSLLVPAIPPPPAPIVEPDIPIVIRKGICSTCNPSPHYTALSYHELSQPFYSCLSSISSMSIPKIVGEVLAHLG